MTRPRIEVRCSEEFRQQVKAAAAATGEDISDFVRAALFAAIRNYPAPKPADLAAFAQISRDLSGAAHNINHLARLANQARLSGAPQPDIAELHAKADRLEEKARQVVAVIRAWV